MEQRISLITLGVGDLKKSRAFYEALGWKTNAAPDDDVAFFQAGGMIFALWGRGQLEEDSGVTDAHGWAASRWPTTPAHPAKSTASCGRPSQPAPPSPAPGRRPSGAATQASSTTPTATHGRSPTTPIGQSRTTARCAFELT